MVHVKFAFYNAVILHFTTLLSYIFWKFPVSPADVIIDVM